MHSVFIDEIDAQTYASHIARDGSTIIIPAGATEQHGAHMPLGVDAMLSRSIAGALAAKTGALVAPTLCYGYKSQPRSGGGNHRVGTTSLSGQSMSQMVDDVVSSFINQGFDNVVLLNGHFENYQFIYEGLDNAVARCRAAGSTSRALLLSYWDFVDEHTLAKVFPDGFLGWDIEHGGILETSLMLLLHPSLVNMERVIDHPPAQLTVYDVFPEDPSRTPASGCLSSAKGANVEGGQLLFSTITSQLTSTLKDELLLADIAAEVH